MRDLDVRAFLAVYGGRHGAWGPEMTALTLLGSGWAVFLLIPLVYWLKTRRLAYALGIAVVTQASTVWLLKIIVGRVRPWLAFGLPAPLGVPHDGSFPSGHAAGSFCVAAFFIGCMPGWSRFRARRGHLVSVLLIPLAALVALSRIYLGAHFPSDVLAGAAIGALIGAHAGKRYARGTFPYAQRDAAHARAGGVECPSKRR